MRFGGKPTVSLFAEDKNLYHSGHAVLSGNQSGLNRPADAATHPWRWLSLRSPTPASRGERRDASRWLVWLVLAGLVHGGVTLLRRPAHAIAFASTESSSFGQNAPTEIDLLWDDLRKPIAPPSVALTVTERPAPVQAPRSGSTPAKKVASVAHSEREVRGSSQDVPNFNAQKIDETDWVDEIDGPLTARPHVKPARTFVLKGEPSAASQAEPHAPNQGEMTGLPRGRGSAGDGGIRSSERARRGAVGSFFPSPEAVGAFRADVCFIEPTVTSLQDITTCKTVATFFTDVLDVPKRHARNGFPGLGARTEWFAIKFRGKFTVEHEDAYTFRVVSDDGAIMEIDGRPMLDDDGEHLPRSVSTNLRLDAGEHDFYLFYYQGPPDFIALQVFVRRSGREERLFGPVF